jgi:DNA-binding NarL/FixJ family response regulator
MIVDSYPLIRFGARAQVATTTDLVVVGEACSGREAVRLAKALQPDVILIDICLPELSGIHVARRLRAAHIRSSVIILTEFDDDIFIDAALGVGVCGYLLKDAEPADILQAIRAVHRGERTFSARIAARALACLAGEERGGGRGGATTAALVERCGPQMPGT